MSTPRAATSVVTKILACFLRKRATWTQTKFGSSRNMTSTIFVLPQWFHTKNDPILDKPEHETGLNEHDILIRCSSSNSSSQFEALDSEYL